MPSLDHTERGAVALFVRLLAEELEQIREGSPAHAAFRRLESIDDKLGKILHHIQRQENAMSELADQVNRLIADVNANTSATDSLLTYVKGVPDLIRQAVADAVAANATGIDLSAVSGVADALEAKTAEIVAAIPANTGAAAPPSSGTFTFPPSTFTSPAPAAPATGDPNAG